MLMTIEQIAEEVPALPSEQRALLADRLVKSLDDAETNRIDRLWLTEAKRRRDEVRQSLVQTIPGDEALARVRRSLGLPDFYAPCRLGSLKPRVRLQEAPSRVAMR